MKRYLFLLIIFITSTCFASDLFLDNKYNLKVDKDWYSIWFIEGPDINVRNDLIEGAALLYKNDSFVEVYEFTSTNNWIEVKDLTNFYYIETDDQLLLINHDKYILEQ